MKTRKCRLGDSNRCTSCFAFFTILRVVARYRLDNLIDLGHLPWFGRLLVQLLPWRWHSHPASRGARLRMALTDLGPIFVKFGQILSTRRDLLPDDIGDELALLQDRVPAFGSEQAVTIIEKSLGKPVDQLFQEFEREPMASASVAQVHGAVLHNGDKVVVKVIRPGIEKVIRKDIALLYLLARVIRLTSDGRRLRPVEVVEDYESTIFDELKPPAGSGQRFAAAAQFSGVPSALYSSGLLGLYPYQCTGYGAYLRRACDRYAGAERPGN